MIESTPYPAAHSGLANVWVYSLLIRSHAYVYFSSSPFVTDITVCYPAFSSFLFLDHNKEWMHAIENPSVDLNFVVYVCSNES